MGEPRLIAAETGGSATESDRSAAMEMESHTFDQLDLQVLSALEVDGRASFSRIGAVLGVSDQTVARRYRRLCAEEG